MRLYGHRLVAWLAWLVILVAAVVDLRKGARLKRVLQCAGAALLVVWSTASWILWGPPFNLLLRVPSSRGWLGTWGEAQGYVLSVAMVLFAAGYFASAMASKNVARQ